jgi:thiamine biosynthesis protein ThiI
MKELWLIKVGELMLKSGNKRDFEERLKANIKKGLEPHGCRIIMKAGRFYIDECEAPEGFVRERLKKIPGIAGFALAIRAGKDMREIRAAALRLARDRIRAGAGARFKVETRRTDKSFPLDSYAVSSDLGGHILDSCPELKVNVNTPDWVLEVEIRELAFLYAAPERGARGLPYGSSGRGMLLLSGGIDSPVAGALMAKRGMALEALHFHSYPYTSEEAIGKARRLAMVLAGYCHELTLHEVSLTEAQSALKAGAREECLTLYLRGCMMRVASRMARSSGIPCLVTGESLGQVASQTIENLAFTEAVAGMPVLRPLVGLDKEWIMEEAKAMGSYGISIERYEDCCSLFAPRHPILKADKERELALFEGLGLDDLLEKAIGEARALRVKESGFEEITPPRGLPSSRP